MRIITFIDLGLPSKLLWARANINTKSLEEYGDYRAWGENRFPEHPYKYGPITMEYDSNDKEVKVVASEPIRGKWGGDWGIPTKDDWQELIDNCNWNWTENYNDTGVAGYIVSSKVNDNAIFFPAAGYYDDDKNNDVGYCGYYWSNTIYSEYPYEAWITYFDKDNLFRTTFDRCYRLSLRPVMIKEIFYNDPNFK